MTGASPVELSIQQAMHFLQEMYEGLSSDKPGHQERQASNCLRFVGLYVALDEVTDEFHIRPKVHLAQELMEMSPGSRAVHHWTYRDEDFGGSVAKTSKRRGGNKGVKAYSHSTLTRFLIKQPVLRMKVG